MLLARAKSSSFAAILLAACSLVSSVAAAPISIDPASLRATGKVDRRFQSYNLEMAEVIGGRFWAPYPRPGEASQKGEAGPSEGAFNTDQFRKRAPVELTNNRRLRVLAKALGPAYIRVSGTWANSTYFHDSDTPAPATPPPGYDGVLTRAEWAGVIDFAKAADARILTSFATSPGARDSNGVWNPDGALRLVNYTRALGGVIYAAQLVNEPDHIKGYSPEAFARDEAVFREFLRTHAPEIKTVGPGVTGSDAFRAGHIADRQLATVQLMSAEPRPTFDIFNYHFYGALSQRCGARIGAAAMISPDQALSEQWLARGENAFAFFSTQRDRFAPAAPIWITETAQSACGGDAWAATFLDTFRYVDNMGRLARRGASVVFHNTLAASDYALIDDRTWEPRPSYWAALLWRRTMGETVLDAGPIQPGLHVYAHCLRGHSGGVGLLAINLDRSQPATLRLSVTADRYTLSADDLQATSVKLNGRTLAMAGDRLPELKAAKAPRGDLKLQPATITYLAIPKAGNPSCG